MIRRMLPNDIEEVGEVWLAASIQAHGFVPESFWRADLRNMTTDILPDPGTRGIVYESRRRIEGFVTLRGTQVGCLFVRPERQGRGIGAALLRPVKQLHDELHLTVYRKNTRATRFYEREGFRKCGETVCPHTGCEEHRMKWTRAAEPGADIDAAAYR